MINGERVRLRPVEKDDLPRYVKWFQDPQVREGLTIFMPLSQGQEEKWFQNHLDGFPANRATQPLAIDTPADDGEGWVHIGSCGFHDIDWRARKAEFGIVIGDKAYWNKGLGTDAVRTLVRFGFDDLNLNRIWLRVFDHNTRAIRTYEKVGFIKEGVWRQDVFKHGKYHDTILMGILREEFE